MFFGISENGSKVGRDDLDSPFVTGGRALSVTICDKVGRWKMAETDRLIPCSRASIDNRMAVALSPPSWKNPDSLPTVPSLRFRTFSHRRASSSSAGVEGGAPPFSDNRYSAV